MTKINTTNAGKRVELVYTEDPYTQLKPGDKGTYQAVLIQNHPFENQHLIKWNNGSRLILLEGVDKFKFIEDIEEIEPCECVSGS